jgi:DNA-binding NarL/FixJ family response regulator
MRGAAIGIIEDNSTLRSSIEDYLLIKDHKQLFSTGKLEEVISTSYSSHPDYILLDEHLEDASGTNAIEVLKQKFPYAHIIIMTGDEKPQLIVNALENGASGFLYKPFTMNQIEKVFEDIRENGSYLHPLSATKLIGQMKIGKEAGKKKMEKLSKKEKVIAAYLIEGKSYKEIATIINKSFHAVNYHIRNMYVKYNVNSKAELIYKLNNN